MLQRHFEPESPTTQANRPERRALGLRVAHLIETECKSQPGHLLRCYSRRFGLWTMRSSRDLAVLRMWGKLLLMSEDRLCRRVYVYRCGRIWDNKMGDVWKLRSFY